MCVFMGKDQRFDLVGIKAGSNKIKCHQEHLQQNQPPHGENYFVFGEHKAEEKEQAIKIPFWLYLFLMFITGPTHCNCLHVNRSHDFFDFFQSSNPAFSNANFSRHFFAFELLNSQLGNVCHVDLFVDIGSWLYGGGLIGQFSETHNF